jgi:hypothetical protein
MDAVNPFATPVCRELLKAALTDWSPDNLARLALADYLRDAGLPECIVAEAMLPVVLRFTGIYRGRGIGRGSGIGSGRGSGRGSGIGIGRGIGRGRGSGRGINNKGTMIMEIGKCYLIHCGDWHTYVGRVTAQVGPMTYRMEGVSKICETNNGDCWDELTAGNERLRAACSYKHYKVPAAVPLTIIAFEWAGKLPQEM